MKLALGTSVRNFNGPSLALAGISLASLNPMQALFVSGLPFEDPTTPNRWLVPDDRPGLGTARLPEPGRARVFDGVSTHIECASGTENAVSVTADFSGSIRFKLTDATTTQTLLASRVGAADRFSIGVSAGYLRILTYNGAYAAKSAAVSVDGKWHELTWEYATASHAMTAYLDGVEMVGTLTTSTAAAVGAVIGALTVSGTQAYSGYLHDLQMYNGATRVHRFTFENTHSTTEYNSGTSGLHGTKHNFTSGGVYTGADVPASDANTNGWSTGTGQPIPAKSSTLDALGNALTYTGKAHNYGVLKDSACGTFDGYNDRAMLTTPITLPVDGVSNWSVRVREKKIDNAPRMLFGEYGTEYNRFYFSVIPAPYSIRVHLNNGLYPDFIYNWNNDVGTWRTVEFKYAAGTFTVLIDGVEYPHNGGSYNSETTSFVVDCLGYPYNTASKIWSGSACDFQITLNGTKVVDCPMQEGTGTIHYNRADAANPMTIINASTGSGGSYWATKQPVFHGNLVNGFSLYTHATEPPLYVPYSSNGSPLSITPPTGYTLSRHCPAGSWHNGAPTKVDTTGGVEIPGSAEWEKAWAYTDDRISPLFSRDRVTGGTQVGSDRLMALPANATSQQLTGAGTYTADLEV